MTALTPGSKLDGPIESGFRRTLVLVGVTLASALQALNVTIANAVLPHIQGDFSAGIEEVAWVLTAAMVGTAIGMPSSGWLGMRFGRRRSLLVCLSLFAIATLLLAFTTSLAQVVALRAAQGIFGGPLMPLGMPILLNAYPKREHDKVMAFWAGGSILATILGPPVGGWLTEFHDWRLALAFPAPFALLGVYIAADAIPESGKKFGLRLDWIGFLGLAASLSAIQLMLDRGNRLDWFDSREITIWVCVAAGALYVFVVRSAYTRHPFIDLRIFLDRNYAISIVCMMAAGWISFAPLMLLPSLLGRLQDVPVEIVSLMITPRGFGFAFGSFVLSHLIRVLDARLMLAIGFLIQASAAWYMTTFDIEVGLPEVTLSGIVLGMGESVIWTPLALIAFSRLSSDLHDYAAAVIHSARFFGGGIGISVGVIVLARSTQTSHAALVESVTPFPGVADIAAAAPVWDTATLIGLARLDNEIIRQASMIGYVNDFWLLLAVALSMLPLIALIEKPIRAK
jgi:DHA2 family multidrug resistance protein